MSDYIFTQNWFRHAPVFIEKFLPIFPDRKSFVEIGSYEGRSTVWFAEHALTDGGTLYCLDTWQGGEEHDTSLMGKVEAAYDHNINIVKIAYPQRSIIKKKGLSRVIMSEFLAEHKIPWIDFAYIDGSHQAADVLTDAITVFWQLKVGGIILFDDYLWSDISIPLHQPRPAIDAFLSLFVDKIEILQKSYQVGIRRIA